MRAIFLWIKVVLFDKDSVIQLQISSAASLCSIAKTIASATFMRSGVKFRRSSSNRSRWL